MSYLDSVFSMEGKVCLVTGASRGIGHGIAEAFYKAGAIVYGLGRTPADTINPKWNYISCDVTDKEELSTVLQEIHNDGYKLNVLVNAAAIDPKVSEHDSLCETSRLENYNLDQWNIELAVGLTGAFLCSKIFGSAMANSVEPGVIVNIASDLSVISPDQRLYSKPHVERKSQPVKPITYSVIKSGLVGMTRYLSTYWIDQGVRCNALSPGGVENGQGPDFTDQLTSRIPMGRMAAHDEYHSAIQFLCSDASMYMNGQNLVIDGGRSVW